jgi:putative Holliday junction resolvase
VDLGSRRIGVAVSDSGGTVATPLEVVTRSGDKVQDHRRLLGIAEEWEVEVIVVGLPLSLDGSVGPAARGALAEVDELRSRAPMPVETIDERLTTTEVTRRLREVGVDARRARSVVDMHAAASLLQAWLDRSGGPADTGSGSSVRTDCGDDDPAQHGEGRQGEDGEDV